MLARSIALPVVLLFGCDCAASHTPGDAARDAPGPADVAPRDSPVDRPEPRDVPADRPAPPDARDAAVEPGVLRVVPRGSEPCGDWERAPVTESTTIPRDPPVPYVKWTYFGIEDPVWRELMLPGNQVMGFPSLALDGSACFNFVARPEVVGCIGPDGHLRWATDGGSPYATGDNGVAVAPDGSVWWVNAAGLLFVRSTDGTTRLQRLRPRVDDHGVAIETFAIGPEGTVAVNTTPLEHFDTGVIAVSRCLEHLWEAGPGLVFVVAATAQGFWLSRIQDLYTWLVSPRGVILASIPPPREASEALAPFDLSWRGVVVVAPTTDTVLLMYVGGAGPSRVGLLYRADAPEWRPTLVHSRPWFPRFLVLADGTLLGWETSEDLRTVDRYELMRPGRTDVVITPPGSAVSNPVLGADGSIVLVRGLTPLTETSPGSGLVLVYSADGTERHRLQLDALSPGGPMVLARDGTLYLTANADLRPRGGPAVGRVVVAVQTDVPGHPVDGWSRTRRDARGSVFTLAP